MPDADLDDQLRRYMQHRMDAAKAELTDGVEDAEVVQT